MKTKLEIYDYNDNKELLDFDCREVLIDQYYEYCGSTSTDDLEEHPINIYMPGAVTEFISKLFLDDLWLAHKQDILITKDTQYHGFPVCLTLGCRVFPADISLFVWLAWYTRKFPYTETLDGLVESILTNDQLDEEEERLIALYILLRKENVLDTSFSSYGTGPVSVTDDFFYEVAEGWDSIPTIEKLTCYKIGKDYISKYLRCPDGTWKEDIVLSIIYYLGLLGDSEPQDQEMKNIFTPLLLERSEVINTGREEYI